MPLFQDFSLDYQTITRIFPPYDKAFMS